MNTISCGQFRALLEHTLRGLAGGGKTTPLHWHEHLLACDDCRELLAAEEALEELLASLPEPNLPAHVTRRVLARLTRSHNGPADELDVLLELDSDPAVPDLLAEDVLRGLAAERRGAQLDALLDVLPDPEIPDGLGDRVLEALHTERRGPVRFRLLRGGLRFAAAAGLAVGLGATVWFLSSRWARPTGTETAAVPNDLAEPSSEPDSELLHSLPVLERWDLLVTEDIDLLLSGMSLEDEALLDFVDEEDPSDDALGGDDENG